MHEKRARTSPEARSGFAISKVDETPIFYRHQPGHAACRDTVLLCDGIGCDGYVWKYLQPELEQSGYGVLHAHYRGHGRSAMPRDMRRVSIQDLCDDLASVLDDTHVTDVVVAGHSMGVQVALEFHRRYGRRCRALILMCGAAGEPLKTFKGSSLLDSVLPTVQSVIGTAPRLFGALTRTLIPTELIYRLAARVELQEQHIRRQDFMPYLRGLSHIDPSFFFSMLAEVARHSAIDFLPEVSVPTLVVAGDSDTFTPPDLSRDISVRIPGAELLVVHEGSHTTPIEHPVEVNQTVLDFLSRLRSDPQD